VQKKSKLKLACPREKWKPPRPNGRPAGKKSPYDTGILKNPAGKLKLL